ncbi:MAG TPA: GNAT family N-acetyltransferase [Bacteroidia bacterium]|nr:GNAT family N-acetyltransferase [Bacteroidia bacterium]
MLINLAEPSQAADIYSIYNLCREALRHENIFQWHDNYPTPGTITADIESGHLYTYTENGFCLGSICLNEEQSPEYLPLPWRDERKILVIHRLAVHPHAQKQGIARKLMDFAEEFAANNGYTSIRLDAYSGNQRSLKFYENRGYYKAGEVYFPGRDLHFNCYEKLL